MKTKLIKIAFTGLAFFTCLYTASAQTYSSIQDLSVFTSIVVNTPIDLTLKQGTESSVSIGEGDIKDAVSAEVKDSVLYLKKGAGKGRYILTVAFMKINKIELLSNCKLKNSKQINSDKLEVVISGAASEVKLKVNVKELSTSVNSKGNITYKGIAESHKVNIKGYGEIDADKLVTISTNIDIIGVGNVIVNAKQDINGIINGAGNITFNKEPLNKNIIKNGIVDNETIGKLISDTTRLKFGRKKIIFISRPKNTIFMDTLNGKQRKHECKTYWSGLGLGINSYANNLPAGYDYLALKANSLNVTFNFWEKNIPLIKNHINIVTGMGFDINNYKFKNGKSVYLTTDTVTFFDGYKGLDPYTLNVYGYTSDYSVTKLTTTYLTIPLLLQFDTSPLEKGKNTFHISTGIIGGVKFSSVVKQKNDNTAIAQILKTRSYFPTSNFTGSVMLRLGYGNLDLYATYGLNSMFKKSYGPKLHPFTVGITLIGL